MTEQFPRPHIERLSAGTYLVDTHLDSQFGIMGAYLIESKGQLALIDPGPTSTLDTVLEGMRLLGFAPEQLTHVILTHIHLDHGGASGAIVRRYPHVQVYVHPIGAPHLSDPSKLIASATMIYKDRMAALWGEIVPVPVSNLQRLHDGDTVQVGERTLQALDTPGHARHHHAYFDPATHEVFAGDVGGIRMPGYRYVVPPTPPPDIDLDAWRISIAKVRAVQPRVLYLGHFGATDDLTTHFDDLLWEMDRRGEIVRQALRRKLPQEEIISTLEGVIEPELEQAVSDAAVVDRYIMASTFRLLQFTTQGYERYYLKLRPDLLS